MPLALLTLLITLLAGGLTPAWAAMEIIRDAETESLLKTISKPVFEAAGLSPESVNFVLVQDAQINAFVAGGSNMFIYTGLLQSAKNVNELIGVIAHETGHISGGHLVRTTEEIRNASATAILATLAGVAAAVASGNAGAGAAAVGLGQDIAQKNFLSYSRTQESAADQAGLAYLDRAGLSANGMHDFLKRLEDQELLPVDQQSEFVRTHPLTRERVDSVAAHISAQTTPNHNAPPQWEENFQRIKLKLQAYLDPRGTLQRISSTQTDFSSRYARALAMHMTGDSKGALQEANNLISIEKNNPYLYELVGQILYETGKIEQSAPAYEQAVKLSGGTPLLRIGLAQAYLNLPNDTHIQRATQELEAAATTEKGSPLLWRLLATAYGRQKQMGMATYAMAEESLARGDKPMAIQQAKRAQGLLPVGSAGWLRSADILVQAERKDN